MALLRRTISAGFIVALVAGSDSAAQCQGRWISGEGLHGSIRRVKALTIWDPDGPGSEPSVLVAGGTFGLEGAAQAVNLATWDGAGWTPLYANSTVNALLARPDGEIIVGGAFTQLGPNFGGIAAASVGRRKAAKWLPMGSGVGGSVNSLGLRANGEVLVAGGFSSAGGLPASRVATWSESGGWAALGSGVPMVAYRVAGLPTNDVVVGGFFSLATSQGTAFNIARWDGNAWHALGTASANGTSGNVHALLPRQDGSLLVGGGFATAAGLVVNNMANWASGSWSDIAGGVAPGSVLAIELLPDGRVIVAGGFSQAGGIAADKIAIWDGTAWAALGEGTTFSAPIEAVAVLPSGEIVVGGQYLSVNGGPQSGWARWTFDDVPWIAVQPPPSITIVSGSSAMLSVTPASGYANLTFQWHRNGVAIEDGTTPHGSLIAGSTSPSISFENVRPEDAGDYTCLISSPCGQVSSDPAALHVFCYPNCDSSTTPPVLTVADFSCFLQQFAHALTLPNGSPAQAYHYANCDGAGSGLPCNPQCISVVDFGCFLTKFAAGCP